MASKIHEERRLPKWQSHEPNRALALRNAQGRRILIQSAHWQAFEQISVLPALCQTKPRPIPSFGRVGRVSSGESIGSIDPNARRKCAATCRSRNSSTKKCDISLWWAQACCLWSTKVDFVLRCCATVRTARCVSKAGRLTKCDSSRTARILTSFAYPSSGYRHA
jgi:hypothetical protein